MTASRPIRRKARWRRVTTAVAASAMMAMTLWAGMTPAQAGPTDPITMPDAALLECINAELDASRSATQPVTEAEAATVTYLNCIGDGITDLAGIEHLTGAEKLYLNDNGISDLDPLASLTQLQTLGLNENDITDLSALVGMGSLQFLTLASTGVTDLSPLTHLGSLLSLSLVNNGLTDVSALASMTSLRWLYLSNNNIVDVTALGNLTTLSWLILDNNDVADVSSLAALTNMWHLGLDQNHITDLSPLSSLTGVSVLTAPDQEVDLGELVLDRAENNPVVHVNGDPVALDDLYDSGANAFTPTTLGARTVTWDDGGDFSGTLSFSVVPQPALITIPDDALRACVTAELGQGVNDDITAGQAAGITQLACTNQGVSDLTGIEQLTGLERLDLGDNDVTGLPVLPTTLRLLNLENNDIEDVSALSSLPRLNLVLNLNGNQITDLSPLSSLPPIEIFTARDQQVDLGIMLAGLTVSNPVVDRAGDVVVLDDLYDSGSNTFAPNTVGAGNVAWDDGGAFSGTLSFTVTVADDSGDGGDGSSEIAPGTADTQNASTLPETGTNVSLTVVASGLMLLIAGGLMLGHARRRTS